jgi:nucleotide-binding universal stress UspA family protein
VFGRILVPIDGSPNSYKGLRYAIEIAKKFDAEITLIHVIEEPVYAYSDVAGGVVPARAFTELEEYADKLFAKRKKELAERGVRTNTLLKKGNPSYEILKASKGFDLIVMRSRGLGRFKRLFLGSVSNGVVQNSKVPVLIVRPS